MSNNEKLITALNLIDEEIRRMNPDYKYKEMYKNLKKKLLTFTNLCDLDYSKFLAVCSGGKITLKEYITKRRAYLAACELIERPEKKISDIAVDYGYSDQSRMQNAIKNVFDKTPGEIRKTRCELPDVRQMVEGFVSRSNRIDAIFSKLEQNNVNELMNRSDADYLQAFTYATEERGFDVTACCLISELSENLHIPFAYLLDQIFRIDCEYGMMSNVPDGVDLYMMDLGITDGQELDDICEYFQCEYYELSEKQVAEYREKCKKT